MPLLNFQNLMGSPLGMAGLGLLMQPTQSYQPINPMAGVAQGMLAAGQYRQNEAESQIAQQRAEMERQRLQYEMEESMRQREREALAQAEAERKQAALQTWLAQQPPETQAIYSVNPELAYSKSLEQQFAKPAGAESREGKLAADLMRANPGLSLQDAMAQATAQLNQRAAVGAGTLTVKQFPPPPTGYYYLDPENPSAGLAALSGGPNDPNTKDLSESQGNATMFYSRANEMDRALSSSNYDPTGVQATFDRMATGPALTNWMASDEGQAYINQGKNFVAAVLRKESGAAITNEEWATGQQLYVDMPGDSAAVRAQKAQNRKLAIEGLKVAAGPGAARLSANPVTQSGEIVGGPSSNDVDPLGLR